MGSDQFDAALQHAPCGCELERRAQREPQPAVAQSLAEAAGRAREAWGCRLADCSPIALSKRHEQALGAVTRMTGWSPPPTCPRASLSDPALVDALRLLPALEHGTLPTLDHLPNVLHEAVYAAAQGKGDRWEYEQKIREQNSKAK